MNTVIFLQIFILVHTMNGVRLPSYFTRCSITDENLSECLTNKARIMWPELVKGDKNLHLRRMNPLEVTEMEITIPNQNLQLNMKNNYFVGLENINLTNVDIDFKNNIMTVDFHLANVSVQGTYNVYGRILLWTVDLAGPINVTYVNGNYSLKLKFKIDEKNNRHYFNIVASAMTVTTDRIFYNMGSLTKGPKRITQVLRGILDESWVDINEEIGAELGVAVSKVMAATLQPMFQTVPIDDLFLDY